MKIVYLLTGFSIVSLISIFSYCSEPDTDRDGVIDEKDACTEVAAKTKNGCPEKKVITDVKIFLETSASIGDYFNPNESTEFKSVVSDLISKVDQNVKPVHIAFIADSTVRYNKSVSEFSREIATTSITPQKSSQLHKIIDQISSETGKGNISILISDCILSFPDQNIKSNPEINRVQADIALKRDIFNTFSRLKKNHYAASIYCFTSKFFGIYYDYQNVKTRLRGESRPFYLWVIVESDLVAEFNLALGISPLQAQQFASFWVKRRTSSRVRYYSSIGQKRKMIQNPGWLRRHRSC